MMPLHWRPLGLNGRQDNDGIDVAVQPWLSPIGRVASHPLPGCAAPNLASTLFHFHRLLLTVTS